MNSIFENLIDEGYTPEEKNRAEDAKRHLASDRKYIAKQSDKEIRGAKFHDALATARLAYMGRLHASKTNDPDRDSKEKARQARHMDHKFEKWSHNTNLPKETQERMHGTIKSQARVIDAGAKSGKMAKHFNVEFK